MSDARDIIEQLLKRSRGPRGPNGILSAGRYGIWPKHLRKA
jgi:hypothetical protein